MINIILSHLHIINHLTQWGNIFLKQVIFLIIDVYFNLSNHKYIIIFNIKISSTLSDRHMFRDKMKTVLFIVKNEILLTLFYVYSRAISLIIFAMLIVGIDGLRLSHDKLPQSQRITSFSDDPFAIRVFCPYSYLNRSRQILTQNSAFNSQPQNLWKNTYLSTLKVQKGHQNYDYNSTYLIQVRSIATANTNNTVGNILYYCGLTRSFVGSCQEDVKYSCSNPGSMFDVWSYQHIDVAFVNLLNPLVMPDSWVFNDFLNITEPLCFNTTLSDQVCQICQKIHPLETFAHPMSMHTASSNNKTEQIPSIIKFRLNPNNWPVSTHIHGLQVRPTMDGHPYSWVSNVGQRGPGAFSAQDQCYFECFDSKQTHTKLTKAHADSPPAMMIRDSKGYDITNVAKINRYPNSQSPGNLWFHDHSMRLTNYNTVSGLKGIYYIRSAHTQQEINVPIENQAFFFMSISQKWKDSITNHFREGEVYRMRFLNDLGDSEYEIGFTYNDDCFNSTDKRITFTVIGTDASLLRDTIEDLTSFTLCSGERLQLLILLEDNFTKFNIYAQQRQAHYAEMMPRSQAVKIVSSAQKTPQRTAGNPYTGRSSINNITLSVPFVNLSKFPEEQVVIKKMRTLLGLYGSQNLFSLNGRSGFDKGWAEQPEIGSIEDYYFINLTPMPHPIHFHLINFQVIRQYELINYKPAQGGSSYGNCSLYESDYLVEVFKSIIKTQAHINRTTMFHFGRIFRNKMQIINYQYICYHRRQFYEDSVVRKHLNIIFPQNAAPNLRTKVQGLDIFAIASAIDVINAQGIYLLTLGSYKYITNEGTDKIKPQGSRLKDTYFMKALKVYKLRVRWAKVDYQQGKVPADTYFSIPLDQLRQYPGFVYHCHINSHEDYEMMRPITLSLPNHLSPSQYLNKSTPCNFNQTTGKYNLQWSDKYQCINDRCKKSSSKQPFNQ